MNAELEKAIEIARGAGAILLGYFNKEKAYTTEDKGGRPFNFVTEADKEADAYIRAELARAFPQDQLLSEETAAMPDHYRGRVWMVDPMDGTKYFVHGNDGFSVMIGLCVDGAPVLGVVYAPAAGVMYAGMRGAGAWKESGAGRAAIHVNDVASLAAARLVTRFDLGEPRREDGYIEKLPIKARVPQGSVGLKLGLIAEGAAEFCFTIHETNKWDICAPQAILEAAGGRVTDVDGAPLDYLGEGSLLTNCTVDSNGPFHEQALEIVRQARMIKG